MRYLVFAGQSATHHFASSNDTSHVVIPILDASRLADWVVIGELLIGWAVVLARNAAGARLAMAILVSFVTADRFSLWNCR